MVWLDAGALDGGWTAVSSCACLCWKLAGPLMAWEPNWTALKLASELYVESAMTWQPQATRLTLGKPQWGCARRRGYRLEVETPSLTYAQAWGCLMVLEDLGMCTEVRRRVLGLRLSDHKLGSSCLGLAPHFQPLHFSPSSHATPCTATDGDYGLKLLQDVLFRSSLRRRSTWSCPRSALLGHHSDHHRRSVRCDLCLPVPPKHPPLSEADPTSQKASCTFPEPGC